MNTFGSQPLYDPRSIRENRHRFRRDKIELLERANSVYCSSGRWPTRGWLLLAKEDYDKLSAYSTSLQLDIGNTVSLKNLSIVQAQCVTRGLSTDKKAIYLIEICDVRGILHNQWFQFPGTVAYNIRAPAYPDTGTSPFGFYSHSLNTGTPWTWTTMLQNMWLAMPLLGTWPGLPSTPTGVPEGFWFPGVPLWYAFCDVLEHLGMTVACDLRQTSPFTIVTAGSTDTVFTLLQGTYAGNLEDDLEWIDVGAGRVPKTVVVMFRRRNQYYGTEETVRYDSPYQWTASPYYSVSKTAPAQFASAVGTHYLWSDFTVRYDMNSAALAADVTTANAIATERALNYFGKIYSQTLGFMTQVYNGALPFITGSQVDGVKWHQDYSNQNRQGWKTSIVRGACPPWSDIWSV